MKKGLNEAIARHIILAQVASDGGKGIDTLWNAIRAYMPGTRKARFRGYDDKDQHITKALDLISAAHGRSGFSYFISKDPGLYDMTLVYFNFKLYGMRYQISFHTYLNLDRYSKKNSAHQTKWDEKDSREAARFLAHELFEAD